MYFASRTHAAQYGPGQKAPHIPHTRKVTIDSDKLDQIMQHLLSHNNVQRLACGSSPLVLSTGEVLQVPAVARHSLRDHMWADFQQQNCDQNGVYSAGISRADFLTTVNCATTDDQKTYAALDQIKVALSLLTLVRVFLFDLVFLTYACVGIPSIYYIHVCV